MANVVSLYDGTTTISLVADGVILTHYVPTAGDMSAGGAKETVTETVEFVIVDSTTALVQAKFEAISRLLVQAVERGGVTSHTAYLQLQATGDAYTWRSEITAFRLVLDDDFAPAFAEAVLGCRLIITRMAYWETTSEIDLGTVHILNGDGVVDEAYYWIGPAGPITYTGAIDLGEGDNARNAGEWGSPYATIEGVLPTPAHLTVTNESGGAITMRRALIANDVYAQFNGAEHLIQSGAAVSWTGSSAHSTSRYYLALSATQIAKCQAAGGVRLLAVFASVSTGIYVRATLLQQSAGPVTSEAWRGPEVLTKANRVVYDLGFVQFPPDLVTFADLYLNLSVYATATGGATLDFIQLCPGLELVTLEGAAISWANNGTMEWFGDQRYGEMSNLHAVISASGRLLLQPGRANRAMVLVEGNTSVDATAKLAINVKYRPRRATI